MSKTVKLGLAALALSFGLASTQAGAADLPAWGGSMKDMPMAEEAAGCYVRGDVGYSWANNPTAHYIGNYSPAGVLYEKFDSVTYDDTWLFEAGVGCARSDGFRPELAFGIRGQQHFEGHIPINTNPDDPIFTDVRSYTAMFNLYYDFGDWGGVTPYVGAGIGFAYHMMDSVHSTDPSSPNPQFGDEDLNFAWSLMAGVSASITNGVVLDVGYRYIDMGSVDSLHADVAGFWNPRLDLDDLTAHEIKVGIRVSVDEIL